MDDKKPLTSTTKVSDKSMNSDGNIQIKKDGTGKQARIYIFFNFILLMLLAGLAYYSWGQFKQLENLSSIQVQQQAELASLQTQVSTSEDELAQMLNNLDGREILINQQNDSLQRLNEELAALRLGINSNGGNDKLLQLSEAASLLRLAQRYLFEGQDFSVATTLYQRSVNLLAQIDDPVVFRINELLSTDLSRLSITPAVDISSLFTQITDLAGEISLLSLGPGIAQPSEAYSSASTQQANSDAGLDEKISAFLRRYFTLRRVGQPIQMPLGVEQISFLQQSIQLQLQQAKLALLQGQQGMYQDTISDVIRLSDQFISNSNGQKATILGRLRQLQSVRVDQETPALSNGLGLLESLLLNTSNEQ
jgi:uroporphyrin-3 C-methyltransferase